jgi:hypothetical protein
MSVQSPRSREFTAKTLAGIKQIERQSKKSKFRGSPAISTNRSNMHEELASIEDVGEDEVEEVEASSAGDRSITPIGNPRRTTAQPKNKRGKG